MAAKKRAMAFATAVLLAVTTLSAPATVPAVSVQEILPEDPVSGNRMEGSVSEDDAQEILPQDGDGQELTGETDSMQETGEVLEEDGEKALGEGATEQEDVENIEEDIMEEAQEGPNGKDLLDMDDTGYTGSVGLQDLQDQEKLDQALADGLVEFIPNGGEIDGGEQRAGAGGGDIIDAARREVGVSGRPNKYTYWLGSISGTYAYAWCHAFVSWCGARAGGEGKIPRTASCFYGAQEFKARGQWKNRISGYVPKAGDIIYFDWNANGGYDHVGIVHYVSGGRVHTIEGNAGDAVRYDGGRAGGYALTDRQIIGYGTPNFTPAPQTRGCLDAAVGGTSTVHVRGWAFDEKDPAQALDIHVYVGGAAGSGAPGYVVRADKSRPDVGAAYPGVGDSHGLDAEIIVNKTGSQPIYVYAISTTKEGMNPLIGSATVNIKKDTERPVISDVEVKDISVEGYTVVCRVSDNVGIKRAAFPSWHERKSGKEAVWFEGTVKNGVAECFIPVGQLGGQSGKYTTHIYVYDRAGNHSTAAAEKVLIDHTSLGQYGTENISSGFIARIESESGRKVLTGLADSAAVVGREDKGVDDQIWKFTRYDEDAYAIQLDVNGAYLAAAGLSEGEGAGVTLREGAGEIPLWRVRRAGEDSYYLDPENGGYVLTQGGGDGEVSVSLQIFGASAEQRFKIQKLSTNVKKLTIKKGSLIFTEAGRTEKLAVSVRPKSAADEKIRWASSRKKVAAVDQNGVVTAIGNGVADITASTEDGSLSVSCRVTVAIEATGVSLDKKEIKFASKGAAKKLLATVTPHNAKDRSVTWSSSDKKVAAVDQDGLVRAVSNGTALITAETADGKKMAVCSATVQIPKVGAGGTVKDGSYIYSADHIQNPAEDKTVIYRQKKGTKKEKLAQVGAKAYLRLIYGKKLYYERVSGKGKRDLYAMDIRTLKKKLVRRDSVLAGSYGRRFLLKPYSAKNKPQPYRILNVVTGKEKVVSQKCLGAAVTRSKIYYVEVVAGTADKGWKARVRSCGLSAGKKKYLTGKIAMTSCEKITPKAVFYQAGGSRSQKF